MSKIVNEQHLGGMNMNTLPLWVRSIERAQDVVSGVSDVKIIHGDLGDLNFNPQYVHVEKLEKATYDKLVSGDLFKTHTDHDSISEFIRAPEGGENINTFNLTYEPQSSTVKVFWGANYDKAILWSLILQYWQGGGGKVTPSVSYVWAKQKIEKYIRESLTWFQPLIKEYDYTLEGKTITLKNIKMDVPYLKNNSLGDVSLSPLFIGRRIPDTYQTGLIISYATTKTI